MPTIDFDKLTIMNDFMFGTVMRKEEFCKPLLEMILGVKIRTLVYLNEQESIKADIHPRFPWCAARRICGGRPEYRL